MEDRKYDQALHIHTEGLREWPAAAAAAAKYHRYEATPYAALDQLFRIYQLEAADQWVDFGCGRGRVAFYIHHRFQIPVTGVEANELTWQEAEENKANYMRIASHIAAPIQFECAVAERYQIQQEDNRFYFFNPFTVHIFKQVVRNILTSIAHAPRSVDLILYYPVPEYNRFLHNHTDFRLVHKVKVGGMKDADDQFIVYRLEREP